MFKFNLGDRVRDVVTGFEGIIIGRTEFLNRCIRYMVQPSVLDKDGRSQDSCHFDEEQLEVKGKPVQLPGMAKKTERTGGPHDAPRRAADPKR